MKKLRKRIAGLLCMILVITMAAGLGVTEVKADDAVTVTEVSTWKELNDAVVSGGDIRLKNDITAEAGNIAIDVSKTVTIDLAGYTIDRACTEAKTGGNVFNVRSGGNLTIKDTSENKTGKITRGWSNSLNGGGCINVIDGTFVLESGNLTGNQCNYPDGSGFNDRGGCIAVTGNGTFIMRGGKISENKSGCAGGVIVFTSGNFEMTGGEITNNTSNVGEYGAGVFVFEGPSLTIGGNAKIYGNKTADGKSSNLSVGNSYLSDTKINLSTTTPLTSEAQIGIVAIASNENQITTSCKDLKDVFFSDNDDYEITTKDGEEGIFYTKKTSYHLWIGGTEVTSANTSGTGWSYDDQTRTLTLDGFNYEGNESGISADRYITIVVKGNNQIKSTKDTNDSNNKITWSSAVWCDEGAMIEGDGTLEVTTANWVRNDGINAVSGTLTINSGTIIATAQSAGETYGIYAQNLIINGGNITAKAEEATGASKGIMSRSDISINGGTVTATAEKGGNTSYGLQSNGIITISSDAAVTASGVTAALNKNPEGYTGEIGTTFISNSTNPNPTPEPTPEPTPTPTPEPTPTPSEPSATPSESTTTSTPASTSTASTQSSQQVTPTIIEGADITYTQGSGNTISFRSSDAFANFQKVMVDNAEISADCYTATEGSIIITLKPEYLSTLTAGAHSISIVSANGVATANFAVQEADTTAVSPKTGDNDQAAVWITLLILSCGALTAVGIRKKVR